MRRQTRSQTACLRANPPLLTQGLPQGQADVASSDQRTAGSSTSEACAGLSQIVHDNKQYENSQNQNINCMHPGCKTRIAKCGVSKCETCKILNTSHFYRSSITGRVYHVDGVVADCGSQNILYLLTCKTCFIQYTGETRQKCRTRMNGHRDSTRCKDGVIKGNKLMAEHFSYSSCKKGFIVQIIQKLPGNGLLPDGMEDKELTKTRKEAEKQMMAKVQTVYPYGLNDRFGMYDMTSNENGLFTSKFCFSKLEHNIKRDHKQRGLFRPATNGLNSQNAEQIFNEISKSCTCVSPPVPCMEILNYSRRKIQSLKKSIAKSLAALVTEKLHGTESTLPPHYLYAILDLVNSKYSKPVKSKTKSKLPPELLFKIHFNDKHVQDIGLEHIFRDTNLLKTLPDNNKYKKPAIVYKYGPTVRSKIFNYRETFQNIDVDDFLNNNLTCDCLNSPFKDPHHQHIVTGNLSIVKDTRLKELFQLGPNFREQPLFTNFNILYNDLRRDIKCGIEAWAKKENLPVEAFDEYQVLLFTKLKLRIDQIAKNPRRNKIPVLKDKKSMSELKQLQEKFIIAPIDKASNNISFTCKKFGIELILKEVGIYPNSNSNTYSKVNLTEAEIVNKLKNLRPECRVDDIVSANAIPYIYFIPKFHKSPVKFRFIVSSKATILKPTSKTLTKMLKLVYNQNKFYCKALLSYTGINHMWICTNYQEVIDDIDLINEKYEAKSTESWDFGTLYTTFELDRLIENINWTIDKAFDKHNRKFIRIYKNEAKFVANDKEGTFTYNKEEAKQINKFLIKNSYFKVGNANFIQNIGIPMGSDPAPFQANLGLYREEFKFINSKIRSNYGAVKKLNHTHRFIDDVNPKNDNGNFGKFVKDIYPPELKVTKENEGNQATSFLEIDMNIKDKKFVTKVYDKRDAFNFTIVNFPSAKSNIHEKILYNVFISQIIRYIRVCNKWDSFVSRLKLLLDKLIEKGAKKKRLLMTLSKYFKNKAETKRFDISHHEIQANILVFILDRL